MRKAGLPRLLANLRPFILLASTSDVSEEAPLEVKGNKKVCLLEVPPTWPVIWSPKFLGVVEKELQFGDGSLSPAFPLRDSGQVC